MLCASLRLPFPSVLSRTAASLSFEARLLRAAVAVVEVRGDTDHAVQAGVVGRSHLGGGGAAHAADGLDGHGGLDVHAGPVGAGRHVRVGGRGAAVVGAA